MPVYKMKKSDNSAKSKKRLVAASGAYEPASEAAKKRKKLK